jgi:protein-S-isoprenylcysteine O-methyltransferase Ste14
MRNRTVALAGSAIFLVAAPGTVAGLIPWWISGWRVQMQYQGPGLLAALLGLSLIAFGAAILLDSFVRFAWQGFGTPAPIAPTRSLVLAGLYRFVRNPMYIAVVILILGQALLLGQASLLAYAAFVWLACHTFVLAYEEPTLLRAYGEEYEIYRRNVGRWLPRLTPWRPHDLQVD